MSLQKSGKYALHITMTKDGYEKLEAMRKKFGVNRSAMIEILIRGYSDNDFNVGSETLLAGGTK